MIYTYTLKTQSDNFYNITSFVRQAVIESGVKSGFAIVFCPHTTAGITINENADPDVVSDLIFALDKTFPDRPQFRHSEGNSAAHLKASCIGSSVNVIINENNLVLGTWQGVFFTEFDGPRTRKFMVKIVKG